MSEEKPFAAEDAEEAAPVIPNAADRKRHKRIKDAAKREAQDSEAFWKSVFGSPAGRREMWTIIDAMHYRKERFVESGNGSPWREATWAEAGIQRIGFQLYLKWTGIDPEGVALMLRENEPSLRTGK